MQFADCINCICIVMHRFAFFSVTVGTVVSAGYLHRLHRMHRSFFTQKIFSIKYSAFVFPKKMQIKISITLQYKKIIDKIIK